jgi:hypothetical protein
MCYGAYGERYWEERAERRRRAQEQAKTPEEKTTAAPETYEDAPVEMIIEELEPAAR